MIIFVIMTIIYPSPIFGPVHSRRLGVSLGINLMPADGKLCTFNCIYCECGFNEDFRPKLPRPTREEVRASLEVRLQDMQQNGPAPDVLTFAGNGEPTAHPHFPEIIADTLALRDHYFPHAKVSVLSNSTFIHKPAVFDALLRVDNNILTFDTRVIVLFLSLVAGQPWLFLAFESIVLEALRFYTRPVHESFCEQFPKEIEHDK